MGAEDAELRRAFQEWLRTRPKAAPGRRAGVLERAERRLIGAIKRSERHPALVAHAERVRSAQIALLTARDVATALPTNTDDDGLERQRSKLLEATAAWQAIPVEDIIAFYSQLPEGRL